MTGVQTCALPISAITNPVVFVIHAPDTFAIVVVALFEAEVAVLILAVVPDAV